MEIRYRKAFLKDLKKLKNLPIYDQLFHLAFSILPEAVSLEDVPNVKSLKRRKNRFRIRMGDYRIGFESDGNSIELMRALHRKEFYRYFP